MRPDKKSKDEVAAGSFKLVYIYIIIVYVHVLCNICIYIYIFVIAIYIYVCLLYISFNILYESTIDLSTLIQCVHICRKFAPTRQSVQSSVAKALSQQLGAGKALPYRALLID